MVFEYKFDFYCKSEDKPEVSEEDTQCCIINLADDWNLVPNCSDVSKIKIQTPFIKDLSQDSWDDSIHAVDYDFNQSYRNDSTAYGSSIPYASEASDADRSETPDLAIDDIENGISNRFLDNKSQINAIDQLVSNLIKNISVLGLYMYYLESSDVGTSDVGTSDVGTSDVDSVTLDNFRDKLHETGQIIEQIRLSINYLMHISGKGKGVLPQFLITKLKQNLSSYNSILGQYQQYVTSSFSTGASAIYPDKTVDQVRILLDEFERADCSESNNFQNVAAYDVENRENIIKYLQDKAKDIEYLEESTCKLNRVYQELFDVLSKRGEQLSSLEQQILISSGCIDRGKMDIQKAYKYKKSAWKRLAYFASLLVITCILLSLPNIIPYLFGNSRNI